MYPPFTHLSRTRPQTNQPHRFRSRPTLHLLARLWDTLSMCHPIATVGSFHRNIFSAGKWAVILFRFRPTPYQMITLFVLQATHGVHLHHQRQFTLMFVYRNDCHWNTFVRSIAILLRRHSSLQPSNIYSALHFYISKPLSPYLPNWSLHRYLISLRHTHAHLQQRLLCDSIQTPSERCTPVTRYSSAASRVQCYTCYANNHHPFHSLSENWQWP